MQFIILDESFIYIINEHSEIRSIQIQNNKHALRTDLIDVINDIDIKNNLLSYTPIDKELVDFIVYDDEMI